MRYVGLSLLGLLVIAILLIIFIIWHKWDIFIHYHEKKLIVELRSSFYKKRLFYRDFSVKPEKKKSSQSQKGKNDKKSKFWTRFENDKKRIYNPENGGFSLTGLNAVLDDFRNSYKEIKDILFTFCGDLRYKLEIPYIWISLDYGTGNPAHTGMLYGTIWSIVGIVYPILARYFHIAYPSIELTPDYYDARFNLEVKSIIKVKPAHIINALLRQGIRQVITYYKNNFTKGSVENG
ncbi:MAG: DUF2953 domain-containing protein [Clostridia bacterium]|nr:DUF2953 domain-containing protein [Clostridia bacterium]